MSPETLDRLLSCARVKSALAEAACLVPPGRRDEFLAASAQAMACILDVPAPEAAAACAQVTAEFDAKKAAQS